MSSISPVGGSSSYYPPVKAVAAAATKPATTSSDASSTATNSGNGVTYESKGGDVIALSGKVVTDKDHDGH